MSWPAAMSALYDESEAFVLGGVFFNSFVALIISSRRSRRSSSICHFTLGSKVDLKGGGSNCVELSHSSAVLM